MSERNWWVGLDCSLCGQRVKVGDGNAIFHRGLKNEEPSAEHCDCRTFHNTVAERLAQIRGGRVKRAGLFNGYWLTLSGEKVQRIRRDEYPELYRLWQRHADIRLGVRPLGMAPGWRVPR